MSSSVERKNYMIHQEQPRDFGFWARYGPLLIDSNRGVGAHDLTISTSAESDVATGILSQAGFFTRLEPLRYSKFKFSHLVFYANEPCHGQGAIVRVLAIQEKDGH